MNNFEDEKICIHCKHMFQGKHNARCGNLKQTDQNLIQYVYWPYYCDLFEKGRSNDKFFINQGFKKLIDKTSPIPVYLIRPEESLTKTLK